MRSEERVREDKRREGKWRDEMRGKEKRWENKRKEEFGAEILMTRWKWSHQADKQKY